MEERKLKRTEKFLELADALGDDINVSEVTTIIHGLIVVVEELKNNIENKINTNSSKSKTLIDDAMYALNALEIRINKFISDERKQTDLKLEKSTSNLESKFNKVVSQNSREYFTKLQEVVKELSSEVLFIKSSIDNLQKLEDRVDYIETTLNEETGEVIVDKINALSEIPENQIDVKHIKGLKELIKHRGGGFHGGVLHVYTDSTLTGDGTVSNPLHVVNGGGGGSGATSGVETPSGSIDASNVTFTVVYDPLWITINGLSYYENSGYTYSLGIITIISDLVPTTGATLRSHHNSVAASSSSTNYYTSSGGDIYTDPSGNIYTQP